ncbi:hypothetical protein [Longimicrobium terrae]|uniref:Uncharacterized protein n=1 Tax=Longimicrobium terrae TaxID=1639882 RepID=A0A841H1Y5_9BACT|nr:hypothetical protein [Longimicrobium terrae]MBB4637748.1 hypothetical protein [Longimicrobium terrae]MBB6072145.1 hypothetical protein [Longimicrobium terrae]NNC29774.1 hypothetical protein [Longimicrobium terrae]
MTEYDPAAPVRFPRSLIACWYDGATDGFLEAEPGRHVYDFRMVAWDDGQDSRIYVLRPLPAKMDDLAAAFFGAAFQLDGWRVLMAEDPGDLSLDREYFQSTGPPAFVVLSDDCLTTVSGVLRVTGGNRAEIESWLLDEPGDQDGFSYSDLPFAHWAALFR